MKLLLAALVAAGVVVAAVLVAGWRLVLDAPAQDGSGTGTPRLLVLVAVDSSGNGHDGVNQGSPAMGLHGHRHSAYSFDRPGSWIQVSPDPALNPGRRDFLFSAWVSFTDPPRASATYDILRKGLGGTPGGEFKLEILSGERVKCSAIDSKGRNRGINSPVRNIADGRWHLIGCARTGSAWSAILDRTVVSKRVALGEIGNTMPLSIGSKYGLEDVSDGRVDEVALFIARGSPARGSSGAARPRARIKQLQRIAPEGLWHLDEQPTDGLVR